MTAIAGVRSELSPYETLGLLGVGGMAKVYAVRTPSGERLALKVLTAVTPALTERFFREARLQQRVHHDNVLPVLDVLEAQGAPALLMPLVVGPSLDVLLQNVRPTRAQSVALFREVVCGVAAIHAIGLVHRDVKPGNVLLDTKGGSLRVMVADFGLAKLLDDLAPRDPHDPTRTKTGAVLGTPAYMAPEQRADASRVDARADVWALGALLFELLTGHRPDTGDVPASADDPWRALAEHLLCEDPAQRPASAVELLALLPQTEPLDAALLETCRSLVPSPAPALPTVTDPPHNLPPARDRFIGRQAEVVEIGGRLSSGAGLLSLVGPAGVGKTRLMLQAAEVWREDFAGGAWLCDLSSATTREQLLMVVASALSVPLGKDDPTEQLGHAIAGRGRCLVLLDNFEQLAEHAESTVGRWKGCAQSACFVVTSRQHLGIAGEEVLTVGPLDAVDAIDLLRNRAASREPRWVRSAQDEAALPQISALLDGLPLAIELCAARAALLSPAALLDRLSDRFRLAADPGGRPDRQRTLRAALDWSWELIDEEERSALCQLTVFEGGFTVEAAEAVLQLQESWPLDVLQALVDKSLVYKKSPERFDLLLSIKEYAAEKQDGAARLEAEQRHGQHFAAFGTDEALEAVHIRGGQRLKEIARDLDNLMSASRRASEQGSGEVAAGTALAAWRVLVSLGPLSAGIVLLEKAAIPSRRVADLLWTAGDARRLCGQMNEARAHYESALALFREAGDRRGEGVVRGQLGQLSQDLGRMEDARMHFESALTISREVGSRRQEATILVGLGRTYAKQGHREEAQANYEAALTIAREIGHRKHEGITLGNLGLLHRDRGQMDDARACFEAALAINREVGNCKGEAIVLGDLALLLKDLGQLQDGQANFEAALTLHRRVGNRRGEGITLGNLGNVYAAQGAVVKALAHYEAARDLARKMGNPRSEAIVLINLTEWYQKQGRVEEARVHCQAACEVARTLGDRRFEGYVLGRLGDLHTEQGRLDEARSYFDAGSTLLREVSDPIELGKLLAARAVAEHLAGASYAAQASLKEAQQLARQAAVGADSELGHEIARALAAFQRLNGVSLTQ